MSLQWMKPGRRPRTTCPSVMPQLCVFMSGGWHRGCWVFMAVTARPLGTVVMTHSCARAFPVRGLILTCPPVYTIKRVCPKCSPGILVALCCLETLFGGLCGAGWAPGWQGAEIYLAKLSDLPSPWSVSLPCLLQFFLLLIRAELWELQGFERCEWSTAFAFHLRG